MKPSRLFSTALIFLLLALPGWLSAADVALPKPSDEPVDLEADQLTFDEQAGRYLASGNVRLKQGDLSLRSDELWWDQKSGDIEASGSVVLEGAQERLDGQTVRYNLNDGTGSVEGGKAFLREQNLYIRGERIEKRGESDYRIVNGNFTTCEGVIPSWKFGAGQLDVTVGGYARARNAVFYLKDIPTLYVPYMIYPAKVDRESGLLMPSIGYSDKRGMEYSGAYYQVISRNQDATIYLDYLSELGIGKGVEYRYVFGRDNAGEARAYHIDAKQSDLEEDGERYALSWDHLGMLPGRIRLSAETEYVSDRDYFEDFGEEAGDYNKDQTVSVVSLSRNWGQYNLVGQFRYSENLLADDPTTLQWLPRITFDAVRQQIGTTPFYLALGSEYTYFWREEGLKAQRLRMRPALLANFNLFGAVDLVPEIGWSERHYWISETEESEHRQKGMYDFSTRLSSRFYRVYPWRGESFKQVRHMLEPDVTYTYIPDVEQELLPEFDRFDRIEESNLIVVGLTQRLTTRTISEAGLSEYRDLLFFRLSQGYDLLPDGDFSERLTPLRGQLILEPNDYLSLTGDSRYDIEGERWSEYRGGMKLHDQRGNRLGVEYRKRKETADDEEIDYGTLDLDLTWLKPVYLGYRNRYHFASSTALEQVLDVEYRHQCWSIMLTLRERDDDKSVMLTFSLGGIGQIGSVGRNVGGS